MEEGKGEEVCRRLPLSSFLGQVLPKRLMMVNSSKRLMVLTVYQASCQALHSHHPLPPCNGTGRPGSPLPFPVPVLLLGR